MASTTTNFVVVVITMLVAAVAIAESEMLQDFCVADLSNGIYLNNTFCFDLFVYSSLKKTTQDIPNFHIILCLFSLST